jgi:hypothetical protein
MVVWMKQTHSWKHIKMNNNNWLKNVEIAPEIEVLETIHEDVEEMEDAEDVIVEEMLVETDDDVIITPRQL